MIESPVVRKIKGNVYRSRDRSGQGKGWVYVNISESGNRCSANCSSTITCNGTIIMIKSTVVHPISDHDDIIVQPSGQ